MRSLEIVGDKVIFERAITKRSDGSGCILHLPKFINASKAKIIYYPQERRMEVFLR